MQIHAIIGWLVVDLSLRFLFCVQNRKIREFHLSLIHASIATIAGFWLYYSKNPLDKELYAKVNIRTVAVGYFSYDLLKIMYDACNRPLKMMDWVYICHHSIAILALSMIQDSEFQTLVYWAYFWAEFSNIFLNIAGLVYAHNGRIPDWLLLVEILGYGIARILGIGLVIYYHCGKCNAYMIGGGVIIFMMGFYYTGKLMWQFIKRMKSYHPECWSKQKKRAERFRTKPPAFLHVFPRPVQDTILDIM